MPEADEYAQVGQVIVVLTGGMDNSPAGMILLGLSVIGLYDKQYREAEIANDLRLG